MASVHANAVDIIQPRQNDTSLKVKLIIHHQFPEVELVSPVYAGKHATCYLSPEHRVNVGSTTQTSFNIDPDQELIGALMYKLERKHTNQPDEETICTQLVIIWKANRYSEFCTKSVLIEHDKGYVWDRDRLIELVKYDKLFNMQHAPIEETWLIHDNTVLMTSVNIIHETKGYQLEMTISKTSMKDDTQKPWYIDVNR
jgi:hypothetical protein